MKREWAYHLGVSREFPRDLGFAYPRASQPFLRLKPRNMQEYAGTVSRYINSQSCFVQLYSDRQIECGEVDKLFFDIDAEDLEVAYKEWQRFTDRLDTLGYEARHFFTGSKGYAVYVDFEPVRCDILALGDFQSRIVEGAGIQADESVFGDARRLCRIPFTPNMKSLKRGPDILYCVPVDPSWSMDRVMEAAKCPHLATTFDVVPSKQAFKDVSTLPPPRPPRKVDRASRETHESPTAIKARNVQTVDRLIAKVAPVIGNGRKRILHFMLVPAMVEMGASDYEIHRFAEMFVKRSGASYNAHGYAARVDDSIRRTREGGWKPWSWDTFSEEYPGVLID